MSKKRQTAPQRKPLLDRLAAAVSPAWARRRSRDRMQSRANEYRSVLLDQAIRMESDAARQDRTNADWRVTSSSADSAMLPASELVDARARDLVRSTWVGESATSAYRRHVVGTGITAKAAARDPDSDEEFRDYNRKLDRLWRRWAADPTACDIERRKTFVEQQGLAIEETITVGESLFILGYRKHKRHVGLVLQMIEPEQLDNLRTANEANGNEVRSGIEIDQYGAPVAYWVHRGKHPMESWTTASERIPAERVIHLMRQRRVRQTHGESRFVSIIGKARDLALYDRYTVIRAKGEACFGALITRDPLYGQDADDIGAPKTAGDEETDANGSEEIIFEPGMVARLAPGEKVEYNNITSPGNVYDPFTRTQAMHIAAGAGLDYQTLVRDFTRGTFSGLRQGGLEFDKETDSLQALMISLLCQRVREEFIRIAILEGRMEAPGFWDDPELQEAYLETTYRGPAKPWIDPARQAAAISIALKEHLTTHRDELNTLGEDWRDVYEQIATEQALEDELGIRSATPQAAAPATASADAGGEDGDGSGGGGDEEDGEAEDGKSTTGDKAAERRPRRRAARPRGDTYLTAVALLAGAGEE